MMTERLLGNGLVVLGVRSSNLFTQHITDLYAGWNFGVLLASIAGCVAFGSLGLAPGFTLFPAAVDGAYGLDLEPCSVGVGKA